MPVDGYNDFLDGHRDIARSPIRATIEFVRLKDPTGETTSVRARSEQLENPRKIRAVLTEDGLPDDSIRSVRYVLHFEKQGQESSCPYADRPLALSSFATASLG